MVKKLILVLAMILAIAMIAVPGLAANNDKDVPQGQPFIDVWDVLTNGLLDLQSDLDSEESARIAADSGLQANIDSEESARIAADSGLQANIDSEESARITADSGLQANIDSEESARIAADSGLQANIDSEGSARIAADSGLQANIDSEESARIAADSGLQANIDSEESARIAADSGLQANIDANDDGRSVNVFTGAMLNPGDTRTHTLYTLSDRDSSHLELLVLAHDSNANNNRLYHHGEYGWYREWSNAPIKQVLGTPINAGTNTYTVDTIANDNDIQVQITYVGTYSTNSNYKIIAKWMV